VSDLTRPSYALSLYKPALLPLAGLVLLGLPGCARRATPAEDGIRTQTLLVGNAAEPADLDPQVVYAQTDANLVYTLFEPLTWIDPKTSLAVPAAAEGWDVSPDGLVYTFHLRPNLRWSNGDPLTADEFIYSYRRILSPAFAASYAYMLWPLKNAKAFNSGKITDFGQVGVSAPDARTLRLTLDRPTPYLPTLVSHQTWIPVHRSAIEKFGAMDQKGTKWTRPGNLVGNGPFMLDAWVPNSRVIVVRNPQYWNAAKTRLNRIEFYPIEQAETEERIYRSGQLHVTFALPTSKIAAYRTHVPADLRIDPLLTSYYLLINTTRPPFDNPKVRQALQHAVDREAITRDVLHGVYEPAYSFTPPNCSGYTARAHITDDFNEARRLLAEAGFPGGRGLPTTEVASYQSETSLGVLEAVQAMWLKELGFHITIAQFEQKTLFQNEQSLNFSIAFSAWGADYPDPVSFLETLTTGNGNNWTGWSNRTYDGLLRQAADSGDNARRYEDFQQAENILLNDAPIIPIFHRNQVYAVNPAVRGWEMNVVNFPEFSKVWLEK
jgi:oligopeptide transport system substrate-binding protein